MEITLTTLRTALTLVDGRCIDHFIAAVDRLPSPTAEGMMNSQLSLCALTEGRHSAVISYRHGVWESLLVPFRNAAWRPRSPQGFQESMPASPYKE